MTNTDSLQTPQAQHKPSVNHPRTTRRVARLTLRNPTAHVRAVLERTFYLYSRAYTELLHACAGFTLDALRGMATWGVDTRSGRPRMNARTLSHHLYDPHYHPDVARCAAGVCAPLEGRLCQSVREHVAQTLMSYVALSDLAVPAVPAEAITTDRTATTGERVTSHTLASRVNHSVLSDALRPSTNTVARRSMRKKSVAPSFPTRLRPHEVGGVTQETLQALAHLDDHIGRERALVARLTHTRQPAVISIPFVGVDRRYGCGVYYHQESQRFFARLDLISSGSRYHTPLRIRGRFVDVKTGDTWVCAEDYQRAVRDNPAAAANLFSFGRSGKSVMVPLELDHWSEMTLRWTTTSTGTQGFALLPQRGRDLTRPFPAIPVTGRLVRYVSPQWSRVMARQPRLREQLGPQYLAPVEAIRYELHLCLEIPLPPQEHSDTTTRPLLAINRGIAALVTGVVMDPDNRTVEEIFAVSGDPLRRAQDALERVRQARQRRGAYGRLMARDRRQARIAADTVALLANRIVSLAYQHHALVVMEDLRAFATGQAVRDTKESSRWSQRQVAFRTLLNRRQFEAVRHAVDKRLELVGLPPVDVVGVAYISQTCPNCGLRDPASRVPDAQRIFRCVRCGMTRDIDEVAAANIARKHLWLRLRSAQKQAEIPADARTSWDSFVASAPVRWPIPVTASTESIDSTEPPRSAPHDP